MPGGDGSGPMGMGPMTGRAAGYCAGYSVPGFANRLLGRFFGRGGGGGGRGGGGGGGRGWRNMYYATGMTGWQRAAAGAPQYAPPQPTPEQEKGALKEQADQLEGMLNDIRKRLDELDG